MLVRLGKGVMYNKYGVQDRDVKTITSLFNDKLNIPSHSCEVMMADNLIKKYSLYIPEYIKYKVESSQYTEDFLWYSRVGV